MKTDTTSFEKLTVEAEKPRRVSINKKLKLLWQIFIVNGAGTNRQAYQV
jgi:hypothetical protein